MPMPPQTMMTGSQVAMAVQQLPEPDRTFVRQASGANLSAIHFGQLALQRGTSDQVRALASEMVDTHTRLNNNLRATAAAQGIELPVGQMTPKQQALYSQLSTLYGAAFDQAFLNSVRQIQDDTVRSFQNEALNGQNNDLAAFANDALPTLNNRVRMVRRAMQQF